MATRLQHLISFAFAAALLAACGNTKPNPADPAYIGQEGPTSSGSMPGGSVLGDSSLIFGTGKDRPGSPKAGTPVMAASPLSALDLPLKVLIWADGDQAKVSYYAPAALAASHHLTADLAANLAGINALTDALVTS